MSGYQCYFKFSKIGDRRTAADIMIAIIVPRCFDFPLSRHEKSGGQFLNIVIKNFEHEKRKNAIRHAYMIVAR